MDNYFAQIDAEEENNHESEQVFEANGECILKHRGSIKDSLKDDHFYRAENSIDNRKIGAIRHNSKSVIVSELKNHYSSIKYRIKRNYFDTNER